MLIIDADGAVVGRLSSKVAKALLNGEEVAVINAEKAIFTGDKQVILQKYTVRRNLKSKQNPEKSPKWPKVPNLLLRRIIRGMIPRKKGTGREAFKRLRVYVGNPLEKEGVKLEGTLPSSNVRKRMSLAELCKQFGWRGE